MLAICSTNFDDLICCLLVTCNVIVTLKWVKKVLCTVVLMYDLHNRTPTFRLPQVPEGKQKMVVGYTPDTKNTVFCEHHWPAKYRKLKGIERPSITTDCF